MDYTIPDEIRSLLLQDARETIQAELEGRKPRYESDSKVIQERGAALQSAGAFVTIHMGSALRGCIGQMSSNLPLFQTIRAMARSAAFQDPRFPDLTEAELEQCSLEISILSPLLPCEDVKKIQIGLHGLYLEYRGHTGVLLPQVAVEQGWNLQEYLDYICRKAGVPYISYEEKGSRLYTFTAIVFSEPRQERL
ncbi:hypothetical protein MASR2M78_28380 [Treponema sp.]